MNNTVLARSLLLSTVAIYLSTSVYAGWLASVSEYSKDDMMTIKILFCYAPNIPSILSHSTYIYIYIY
jgi:hypothetical protein